MLTAPLDELREQQLFECFGDLLETSSWSALKLDLYGLEVLLRLRAAQDLGDLDLVNPPRG